MEIETPLPLLGWRERLPSVAAARCGILAWTLVSAASMAAEHLCWKRASFACPGTAKHMLSAAGSMSEHAAVEARNDDSSTNLHGRCDAHVS